MPKTLLAVDDSATMRKVLEITFSGEDFHVVTAESTQAALAKLGDKPAAVVIDTSLGGDDGYALCREVRKRDPGATILLLASRYAPYDVAKGRDAGADDYMDKPFDTQQMIDKLRKAMLARDQGATTGATAPAPSAAPAAAARPAAPAYPAAAPQAVAAPAAASPAAAAAKAEGKPPARSHTLMFGEAMPANVPPAQPRPIDAPSPKPATASPTSPSTNAVSASVNGQLAGRLGDLGLSASQVDAVLALSRDVVERVVWEVVPQLAEALIKEEIARLTRP